MDIQEVTIDEDYDDDGSDDGENEFDFLNTSTAIQPISRKNQPPLILNNKLDPHRQSHTHTHIHARTIFYNKTKRKQKMTNQNPLNCISMQNPFRNIRLFKCDRYPQ